MHTITENGGPDAKVVGGNRLQGRHHHRATELARRLEEQLLRRDGSSLVGATPLLDETWDQQARRLADVLRTLAFLVAPLGTARPDTGRSREIPGALVVDLRRRHREGEPVIVALQSAADHLEAASKLTVSDCVLLADLAQGSRAAAAIAH